MTYHSNHMEGSKLSEDQTRFIFETNTVDVGEGIPVDDIIETVNHFRAIDYVIKVAEETLTEDIIKELHRILKQSTRNASLSWFAVGDYKKRANVVGGRKTAKPKEVPVRMQKLLSDYDSLEAVNLHDIICFHYDFARIHPFQKKLFLIGSLRAFSGLPNSHFGVAGKIDKILRVHFIIDRRLQLAQLILPCIFRNSDFSESQPLIDMLRPFVLEIGVEYNFPIS